jgi:prolyl-tRNA synthetase
MPLGLRVLRKVECIIREEMDRCGAIELLMPVVQPAELWKETARWDKFGSLMLRMKDRYQRDFCFGPTHEEVITDILRREINSYRQLPLTLYQIQTKFRDEIRPRFGVMRAREFLMKDAYSFHVDNASLEKTYNAMHNSYTKIFSRLGLNFRAVEADSGAIGGGSSHEFHVLADSGEDSIAFCPDSTYAANIEFAKALHPDKLRERAKTHIQKIATPNRETCEEVAEFLNVPIKRIVKTLAVVVNDEMVLLLLRGDHNLNELKAQKIPLLQDFRLANEEEISNKINCRAGYIGPIGTELTIISDVSVMEMSDFTCGSNEEGYHYTGVNFGRDMKEPSHVFDIRNVISGDLSPDGKGKLEICRGIEVGHIFKLHTEYSKEMKACYLNESGQSVPVEMGCYGIGVSRIVAAAIEQKHDKHGIVFPLEMAPFQVVIIPIGMNKSALIKAEAERLYEKLSAIGIEVLLDDRNERPGVMFADMELIGIPHRIVIGERGLKEGNIEYKGRCDDKHKVIPLQGTVDFIKSILYPE